MNYQNCLNLGSDCCGCENCVNVCPKNVLQISSDCVGFMYPSAVDTAACIECGLCAKVCPVINSDRLPEQTHNLEIFGGWIDDDNILKDSSSGGFFWAAAKKMISEGGYVGGVVYDDDFKSAKHALAEDLERAAKMRGSKYVQSAKGDIFKKVKEALKTKKVFFTGTHCEIAALKTYIGGDHPNLISCDLLCFGSTSPRMLSEYVEYLEKKYKSRVVAFSMRDKSINWKMFTQKTVFENGKTIKKYLGHTQIGYAFVNLTRESCYKCKFRDDHRMSDITIGDFWSIAEQSEIAYNKTGTSVIICNTQKGLDFFNSLKNFSSFHARKFYLNNPNVTFKGNKPRNKNRTKIEKNISENGLIEAVNMSLSTKQKILQNIPFAGKLLALKKNLKNILHNKR